MDGAGRRVVVVVRADFGVKNTRMDRPRLAESAVEPIRRERYAPRRVQFDYLHLRDLRARLLAALPRCRTFPARRWICFAGRSRIAR